MVKHLQGQSLEKLEEITEKLFQLLYLATNIQLQLELLVLVRLQPQETISINLIKYVKLGRLKALQQPLMLPRIFALFLFLPLGLFFKKPK